MPINISGSGFHVTLTASVTFPSGISISAFADDGDPFDTPSVKIAESALTLNGDLVTWNKASPTNLTMNLIPGSEDDINLRVLAEANRAGKGKTLARDVITVTGTYPDGKTITLSGGIITDYVPGDSITSAGRKKSHPYAFAFETISRS